MEGGSPTEGLTPKLIASTYGTAIYQGDPVARLATGYIARASVTTTAVAGIMYNCEYLNTNVGRNIWWYWPASGAGSNGNVGITDDPDALFLVQSTGSAVAFADIGANIGFAVGTGNSSTGISAYTVDNTTIGTSSALPFRIIGLYSQFAPPGTAGTDDTYSFNWVVVSLNDTARSAGTTGV